MTVINDLIVLKSLLKKTRVGNMSNDSLRNYLKLSLELNKYNSEFEKKRMTLAQETVAQKGYDINHITPEQDREIFNVIAPILDEYLGTEVDVNTKILPWEDLYSAVLCLPENNNLTIDEKTTLTTYLCSEEL